MFLAMVSTSPSREQSRMPWPSMARFTSSLFRASPWRIWVSPRSMSPNFPGFRTKTESWTSGSCGIFRVRYLPVCPAAPKITTFFITIILSVS